MFHVPENLRSKEKHPLYPTSGEGNNGIFKVPLGKKHNNPLVARCIASDGEGWEHVSVSLNRKRCPTWDEMCMLKILFWDEDDCVIQYHPPGPVYVNDHEFVLHMWRPTDQEIPMPPSWMV